jgi:ABC-type transport system substrate-binding protein
MDDRERAARPAGAGARAPVSRRTFLHRATLLTGAGLAGGLLAACGAQQQAPPSKPAAEPTKPSAIPAPAAKAEAAPTQAAPAQTAPAAQQAASGKPITFVEGTDVTQFDPTLVTDTPTWSMLALLYDGLVSWDKDLKVQPALATKWTTSDDRRTWTFELRDGVKFHDGSPFTSESVKFSIDRVLEPDVGSAYRAIFANIFERIDTPDPRTVRITTKEPYPDLLVTLAPATSGMLHPATVQKHGKDYGRNPNGTGPFMLKEWVANERLVLVQNPSYWGTKPQPSQITYRPIPEGAARAAVLKTGEADIVVKIPPEEIRGLEGDANVEVHKLDSMYQVSWEMFTERTSPPFNDKRFRQALNHAVDKQAITRRIMQDLATPMVSPFTPNVDFRATFEPYAYDPDKAKQLLSQVGASGAKVSIWSPQGRYLKDKEASEAVVNFLREVGLDAELRIWEWSPYLRAVREDPDRQAYMLGRATPGADFFTTRLFTKGAIGQYNVSHFNTPRVEELAARARGTFDETQRATMYKEIQQIVWDEAPWLFGYNQKSIVGSRKNVQGWAMLPQEAFLLDQVTKA